MNARQATEKKYTLPKTLAEAASLITKLGFSTPSLDEMQSIKQVCGFEKLAIALTDTLNGESLEENKRFLSGILGAIAPSTLKRLEIIGIQIPSTEVLVRIGAIEGSEFVALVREASTGSSTSGTARDQLVLTLVRFKEEEGSFSMPVDERPVTGNAMESQPTVDHVRSLHAVKPLSSAPNQNDEPPEDDDAVVNGKFQSTHVYGGGFALCFNAINTKQGIPSINLDAGIEIPSKKTHGGQKIRTYSWKDKITVQFTGRELHLVYAVLMGYMDEFQGSGHGAAHDKWFTLSKQEGKIYVSVHRRGAPSRGVPITSVDICPVISLLALQLLAGAPHLTLEQLNFMAQRAATLANEFKNASN